MWLAQQGCLTKVNEYWLLVEEKEEKQEIQGEGEGEGEAAWNFVRLNAEVHLHS